MERGSEAESLNLLRKREYNRSNTVRMDKRRYSSIIRKPLLKALLSRILMIRVYNDRIRLLNSSYFVTNLSNIHSNSVSRAISYTPLVNAMGILYSFEDASDT